MSRTDRGRTAFAVALAAGILALAAGPAQGAEVMGPIGAREWWLYGALNFSGAWPSSLGDGTTVAVIGDVVDSSNADLSGSLQEVLTFPPNIAVTDANVPGEDCFANETASLIAGHGHATSGGSDGVIGLAAHAKVDPIAVAVDGNHIAVSAYLAQAIHVAVGGGAKIIDIILPAADDATVRDAVDYALASGTIVVAPSGNNITADNIMWTPAALKGVLAVGGIQQSNLRWWPSSAYGAKVSVAAPATDITADGPGGKYVTHSGTNCAAALTAGEAALVWSLHPAWTAGQVEQVILDTASGNGSRIDNHLGYGTINPTKAVAATAPARGAAPLGTPPKPKPSSPPPVAVPSGGNAPLWMVIAGGAAGLAVIVAAVFLIRWQRDRKGRLRHGYVFEPAPIINVGPAAYGEPAAEPYGEYVPPAPPVDYSAWGPEAQHEYPAGGYPVGEYRETEHPSGEYPSDEHPSGEYPAREYTEREYTGREYTGREYTEAPYSEAQYPETQYPETQYPGGYQHESQPDTTGYAHWPTETPEYPPSAEPSTGYQVPVEQAPEGQAPVEHAPAATPDAHQNGGEAEQTTDPAPPAPEEPPAANPA